MGTRKRWMAALLGPLAATALAAPAGAAITPSEDGDEVASGIVESAPDGTVTGSAFETLPPAGTPAGSGDENLAAFPLHGERFGILSTGNAGAADDANDSGSTSTDNGGASADHGNAFDVVTLRVDLEVPADRNCLTMDFRFLSEEFPEFVGSQFNDGFVAELDGSSFVINDDGRVTAPDNFAIDENGRVPTVNTTGTSADNALGTTYDGATPILRATTPVTPGPHALRLSVYDSNDAIFDSAVLLDNLRIRSAPAAQCVRGAVPTPSEGGKCQGLTPTIIAADGVATGTMGDDVILGSKFSDEIRGRAGDDVICGRGGKDDVRGGGGSDTVQGNNGKDRIQGRSGDDDLRGNKRSDQVFGNGGDDRLRGKRGDDELRGGRGTDDCGGGKGSDREFGCER